MSSSSTYSSPVTPPADLTTQGILDQISGIATQYAGQIYSWGQGVFNNLQNFTNQNVAQLTQAADQAMSGASTAMTGFQNSFMPDYQALRTEAANYANPGRQARNAGMAESTASQAGDAARVASEQQLQSFGIDPSSGRYADLNQASNTATAASAAGAGTASIRADETTALGLQAQAIAAGEQLPGFAANFENQANQARSIAQNAQIGTANTGANLMQVPNAYLSTAMNNKYPPVGQSTQSHSQGPQPQSGNKGGGGNQGGGNQSGGSQGAYQSGNGGTNGPGPAYTGAGNQGGAPGPGTDPSGMSIYNGGQTDPLASLYGGYNTGGNSYNPGATNTGGVFDTSASLPSGDAGSGWANSPPATGDTSSGYNPGSASDWSNASTSPTDYSNTGGGGGYSGGGGYAAGGAIPDPTTGGQVPQGASPSQGMQTDDVHASLNADEFVIPKDVALWKGQEFFQKLIAQSRKNLATSPAKGQPAPAPTGPVTFSSQPLR